MEKAEEKPWVQVRDLRGFTRDAKRCLTVVSVQGPDLKFHEWILAGACSIQKMNGFWSLTVAMEHGLRDQEGDRAYALTMDVVGLEMEMIADGRSSYKGWIRPRDHSALKIAPPEYERYAGMSASERRKAKVEYVPGEDDGLVKTMSGRKIEIYVGPPAKDWE